MKLKEDQEKFKAELQAMREAAQWRRLQVHNVLKNMNLGPRKLLSLQLATLSVEKALRLSASLVVTGDKLLKLSYLEAYNEAAALASNEEEKQRTTSDADLVDKYNKRKTIQIIDTKASRRGCKASKEEILTTGRE
ncbi:hypothetical protein CRYUN_Cryun35bG0094200 [Craigia yunnanensis]